MVEQRRVEVVVCAAPLADQAHALVDSLIAAGWSVSVTTSLNAVEWVDQSALDALSVDMPTRVPGQPRPAPAAAVLVVPATFNTLNKLRSGVSDTPALGVLNDAVGQRLPLLVVPMISERLVDHPAWVETLAWLHDLGVAVLDPTTGKVHALTPLSSGSGSAVAGAFDAAWLTSWLAQLP